MSDLLLSKKVKSIALIIVAILILTTCIFINQNISDSELIAQAVNLVNAEDSSITVRNIHIMKSGNNKYVYFEKYNKDASEFIGLGACAVIKQFNSYKITKVVMNTPVEAKTVVICCSIDNIFFGKVMDESVFKMEYYDAGGILISSVKTSDKSDFFYFTIPDTVEPNTYPQISSVIYDKEGNII